MANRNFPSQRIYNMHMMQVQLDAQLTIGASGAPTVTQALGISSITRISAGRYRVLLQDPYVKIVSLGVIMQTNGASASGVGAVELRVSDVANAAAPSFDIQCFDNSSAAVDPANGSGMIIRVSLSNSSVQ